MKSRWGILFLIGCLNTAIPFCLLAFATLTLTAGLASIINAMSPLFGGLIAWIWLKERFNRLKTAGLLIGFSGVVILMWDKEFTGAEGFGLAALAAVFAAFLYGFSANLIKKKTSGIQPLTIAAGSQIGAALCLVLPSIWLLPPRAPSPLAWFSVIFMAVICTSLAYIMYFRLISQIGPYKAIAVTFMVPAFGMLWGAVFLAEIVTWNMIAGCVVILLGTALTTGLISPGSGAAARAVVS